MIKVKKYLIYKKMVNIFISNNGKSIGFCRALKLSLGVNEYYEIKVNNFDYEISTGENIINQIFTELCIYKPTLNEDGAYWFDRKDSQKRIDILKSIISNTQKTFSWYERLYLILHKN